MNQVAFAKLSNEVKTKPFNVLTSEQLFNSFYESYLQIPEHSIPLTLMRNIEDISFEVQLRNRKVIDKDAKALQLFQTTLCYNINKTSKEREYSVVGLVIPVRNQIQTPRISKSLVHIPLFNTEIILSKDPKKILNKKNFNYFEKMLKKSLKNNGGTPTSKDLRSDSLVSILTDGSFHVDGSKEMLNQFFQEKYSAENNTYQPGALEYLQELYSSKF